MITVFFFGMYYIDCISTLSKKKILAKIHCAHTCIKCLYNGFDWLKFSPAWLAPSTFWSLNCGSNGKLFPKHKQLFLQLDSIFEPLYMNIRDVNVYVFLLDIFYYIYTFVSIYNPQVSCASSIYIFYLNGFLQFCDYQTMVRC